MLCLQVRDSPDQPWRLQYGEIIGFTPEPGVEYRMRILEDTVENPPAGLLEALVSRPRGRGARRAKRVTGGPVVATPP